MRHTQAGVDNNLKMAHVSKEGYGAIPDYKEIADQSKKVAILQVIFSMLSSATARSQFSDLG